MQSKNRSALTLLELVIAMAISSILMLAAGVLLFGSHKAYAQMYASVHEPIQQDSKALTSAFCAIGRKSNRANYKVYTIRGNTFTEAVPEPGRTVAVGQAVEFRHWKQSFRELTDSMNGIDVDNTGTHYALFYFMNDKIYVDQGLVVDGVGGVQNGRRRASDIDTQCLLARNVRVTEEAAYFSHPVVGGAGSGCVSLNVTLENEKGQTVEIKTATLLRVVWPQ